MNHDVKVKLAYIALDLYNLIQDVLDNYDGEKTRKHPPESQFQPSFAAKDASGIRDSTFQPFTKYDATSQTSIWSNVPSRAARRRARFKRTFLKQFQFANQDAIANLDAEKTYESPIRNIITVDCERSRWLAMNPSNCAPDSNIRDDKNPDADQPHLLTEKKRIDCSMERVHSSECTERYFIGDGADHDSKPADIEGIEALLRKSNAELLHDLRNSVREGVEQQLMTG